MSEAPDPREQEDCSSAEVCEGLCDQHAPEATDPTPSEESSAFTKPRCAWGQKGLPACQPGVRDPRYWCDPCRGDVEHLTEHPAVPTPGEVRLSEEELRALRKAYDRDVWAGEWNSVPTEADRILAARLAARDAEVDGLRRELDTARTLHGQAAYYAEGLAEELALLRASRRREEVKPTGVWLNADGTTSPVLPATMSAEVPPTDWAAVATRVTGHLAEAKARAEAAEAEVADLQHDYDSRGERLWRLAGLTGYVPNEADNDATAELVVSDALAEVADLRATRERMEALADEWEAATCIADGAPCSFHRHATGYADDLRAALGGEHA